MGYRVEESAVLIVDPFSSSSCDYIELVGSTIHQTPGASAEMPREWDQSGNRIGPIEEQQNDSRILVSRRK